MGEPVTAAGPAAATSAREPRRRRGLVLWLAAVVTLGLLLFTYHHLGAVVEGQRRPFLDPLTCELTAAFAAGLLFFPVRALVRRRPLERGLWLRRLPVYAGALVTFAAVHTTMMWGSRVALFPLVGLGRYDYGAMPLRYLMELPMQALGFTAMVGALHAVRLHRQARERELRAARLESSLAQAQLRNLRLQLQPHFLFNALNTVSATMYRDPAAADEMLDALGELLRASLRTAQTDEVPLRVELEVLDRYLAVLGARFGERLQVSRSVEPETVDALVPSMILQPLVENAVRHGNAEKLGRGRIAIRAARRDGRLMLEVEDDGPGAAASTAERAGRGVGLAATAERLQLLYGDQQCFAAGNAPGGGFRVTATMPYRAAAGRTP